MKHVKIFKGAPEEVEKEMDEWISKHSKNISDILMTQSSVCQAGMMYPTHIAVTLFYRFTEE